MMTANRFFGFPGIPVSPSEVAMGETGFPATRLVMNSESYLMEAIVDREYVVRDLDVTRYSTNTSRVRMDRTIKGTRGPKGPLK
jgi:hypothetical protein